MDPDAAGRAALGFNLQPGEIQRLPADADGPARVAKINELVDAHNKLITQQIWTDGKTRRMLVGYQFDGWGTGKHWGVKIAAEGDDVLTAALVDLLFYTTY